MVNMLAMKGVKYIFKRDFFWRTWRQVEENGNFTVVCYRCQNNKDGKCQNGGYWVIEEKPPPCPYEIFSVKTDWEICAVKYNQYPDPNSSCPSVINRLDLKAACDNPIKTRWRIARKFDEVSERNTIDVICQGRENCEISTLYTILPDMVVFRIINSTNHIIYSRVMKTGFKNYICIDDCGRIDPKTNLISRKEQPYRLDLFKKNKREDLLSMTSKLPVKKKKCSKLKQSKGNFYFGLHLDIDNKIIPKENEPKRCLFKLKNSVTKITCKKIAEKYFEKENSRDY
ncbi:uncharacterized protein LOC123879637 isoform X2 [Maniola jurtina]|uniref:uncharacterized protein LOC123879637 isoform X2 n=1 Tax=Maniola jurtina TaxID=191418 RepID=UPI001E68FD5B|nr:uncharacterized protein LOC123879637 isoform X2 [Maniola jurtina]